jgi:hypothetical protein
MARFDEYAQAYQTIRMERRNGIVLDSFFTTTLFIPLFACI